jgi:outer membrane protein OmpA-like peptidoglycan-associated protein
MKIRKKGAQNVEPLLFGFINFQYKQNPIQFPNTNSMIKYSFLLALLFPLILSGQSKPIKLAALPAVINTSDNEELGRWSLDGKTLLFTRKGLTASSLYAAKFESKGKLISVEKFPFDSTYRGGGHAISPDGKNLIFTSSNQKIGFGSSDLYLSELRNGKWSPPQNMGPSINGQKWDGEPAFGNDGTSFYFTSNRPGGMGGYDIWIVRQSSPGHWSNAVNAGPGINTPNNEGSCFVHFDGRTIYFMRDGNQGMGGYDLYIAHMGIDGKWKPAENMGSSINSNSNEGGLALYPDGVTALITRATPDRGNELYEFELPPVYQSTPVQALHVNVTDAATLKPVRAQLEVFDFNGMDTIRQSQIADEKGNITVTLDRNMSYGVIASAEGYVMNSTNLQPTKESSRNLNVKMISLASSVSKTMALQNIFFETGSYSILSSSEPELNSLARTLQNNPGMKIEIRGHTDNVGDAVSNQLLSENRAKSVFIYLTGKGITADRIAYKGFGEKQPLGSNDTEEGRKQNRRTEFVITTL